MSKKGMIVFFVTPEQAEAICKHYGKDVNELENYEVCALLNKLIDSVR